MYLRFTTGTEWNVGSVTETESIADDKLISLYCVLL